MSPFTPNNEGIFFCYKKSLFYSNVFLQEEVFYSHTLSTRFIEAKLQPIFIPLFLLQKQRVIISTVIPKGMTF